jgi:hypothetical protein
MRVLTPVKCSICSFRVGNTRGSAWGVQALQMFKVKGMESELKRLMDGEIVRHMCRPT